jgi:hypothetical protein
VLDRRITYGNAPTRRAARFGAKTRDTNDGLRAHTHPEQLRKPSW